MADLIDRQALGVGRCSPDVLPAAYCAGWNGLINLIESAPTIDPESLRKKGEWLERRLDNFRMLEAKCSECGWTGIENYDAYVDPFDFNFCPNCGADMRGET